MLSLPLTQAGLCKTADSDEYMCVVVCATLLFMKERKLFSCTTALIVLGSTILHTRQNGKYAYKACWDDDALVQGRGLQKMGFLGFRPTKQGFMVGQNRLICKTSIASPRAH